MAIWDKVKQELDTAGKQAQGVLEKAGKAAQDALEEGKTRVDAFRARQQADRAAQALGYAVFRAEQSGAQLDAETRARLTATLAEREAEATRLEAQIAKAGTNTPATPAAPTEPDFGM